MDCRKTILLLGGSAQQIPVINAAQKMGLRTVICDYLTDNPGQYIADAWYPVSTTDIDAVYEVAKKENVDGILAYASDPAALPAAIVCERLGLPTNPSKAVAILSEKHIFRKFLKENGFAYPRWVEINNRDSLSEAEEKVAELHFPVVIKPTDSSGSKGVSVIRKKEELGTAIRSASQFSGNGIIIAEEYIERSYPNIIAGDIFIENGKIIFRGDMECVRSNKSSLIPVMKVLPHHLSPDSRENLFSELQDIIKKLNISCGELNIDVIINRDGRPYFLEIGGRAGGNMIPLQLSDAYGINLIEANIKTALGQTVELKPCELEGVYVTYVLNSHKSGTFDGVQYSRDLEPYVYREYLYKKPGDRIEPFTNARNAIGIIFMHFPDVLSYQKFSENLDKHIEIILK